MNFTGIVWWSSDRKNMMFRPSFCMCYCLILTLTYHHIDQWLDLGTALFTSGSVPRYRDPYTERSWYASKRPLRSGQAEKFLYPEYEEQIAALLLPEQHSHEIGNTEPIPGYIFSNDLTWSALCASCISVTELRKPVSSLAFFSSRIVQSPAGGICTYLSYDHWFSHPIWSHCIDTDTARSGVSAHQQILWFPVKNRTWKC